MIYLTNGNIPLNAAYADEIVQIDSNTYQLAFRFPTSDPLWEKLKEETFLTADDLHGEQDFVIFEVEKKHGYIQVYANQVFTLLNNYVVNPISLDRQTGSTALSRFAGSITRDNPFSFFSDIEDRHTFNVGSKNAMEAFAKDKHSIIGQWGGDLVRHGYQVRLLKNGGSENESLFMYKKNLSSYQHKTSTKSLKTRITFKTTVKGEGEKPVDKHYKVVVDSPLINKYSQIYEDVVEVNDQDVVDEATLLKYGKQYFRTTLCDMLEDSLELEVVGQSDVPVQMFDIVSIFHEHYNLDVRKKITKYTYSPMAKKLKSIGFGQFQSGLANAIGNAVSDAVKGEAQQLQDDFERQLARELKNADLAFDRQKEELVNQFTDGLNAAKARAEEVKRQLSDTIDQRFSSFNNGPLQEAKRRAEEALRNAGASSLLAQEAKRIGLDSIAKLDEFKRQATSAQTALSGDLDVLKLTVANEVNQASEYRRTTTEALSRMTGQMNGFATKSEVAQGIDGLTQTFAKMRVGGRNYAEDYDFSRGLWQYNQGDSSPQDWTILNGEYNVKGTTKTWKQLQIHSKEGSHASRNDSIALIELEVGETYTLSFQGICYSGSPNVWASLRANRTAPGNPEIIYGNFTLTPSWQTYQVTIPALTKPDNFDFWRIILGYNEIGHVAFRKVELTRSSTRIDAGPAPEDGKSDLIVAKSEFQKTADGLSAKLAMVENYVGQDGQRQEALRRYTREESAKQATSVRELVNRDFVGKASYQEDVRAIERKFEAITNPQNGSIATQIANYKTAVDGRFTDITSLISGKASQADFQRVKETSQLYERIIGNNENDISNKVARMALTNQLFQVEVSKYSGNGVNRALNTTSDWGPFISRSGGNGNNLHADLHKVLSSGFKAGDTVHVRMEISIDDVQRFNDKQIVAILQSYGDVTNWTRTGRTFDYNIGTLQSGNNWRLIEFNTVMTEEMLTNNSWMLNLRIDGAKSYKVHTKIVKIEKGNIASAWSPAPEDTDEAIRTAQSQLAGSWAVQNLTSTGSIVSQINATNNQILIEAEKIRLKGKTLLDELTAIQGYFKRLFVGDASVGTLNSDIIRSNSITADKLVMDMAMARRFVSSDIFTDTLAAKEAFINKLRSVVVTATLLEGFQGLIGGFRFGQYTNRNGYFITGTNSVSVGMGNGMNAGANRNAFWANWGESLDTPGPKAWYVNTDGKMYCRNEATFHSKVDFSSISNPNFYSKIKAHKGVWVGTDDVNGEGDNPAGGYNAVVWWSQIVTGKFRQHAGITTGSDRKLKENIEPTPVKALDKINALNLVAFDYIKDKTHEEIGLIAQEVLNIIPSSVEKYEDEDNHLTINYSKFVPYLIKAIQELNQKIEKMEKTIA